MTQQEQVKQILDPTLVLVLDTEEILRVGLTPQLVIESWNVGILFTANIYKIKNKADLIEELKNLNE